MDHIQIIEQYEAGRLALLEEVKILIAERGVKNSSILTGLHIVYISDLKCGRRNATISYQKLLQIKNDLTNDK